MIRERPRCRCCNGPLDIETGVDSGQCYLGCNNLAGKETPIMTDEEFWERWDNLDGDDIVKLSRYYE